MKDELNRRLPLEQLVRKVLDNGDQRAFRELVEQTQQAVFRVALRTIGSESDAEEVTQETYVRAWTSLDRFNFRSSIVTWLCRIAINISIDMMRQRKRRPVAADPQDSELAPLIERLQAPEPGPEEQLADAQLQAGVQKLLMSLKPKHRTVLALREIDGLSYDEIAVNLGISRGTVESRLHRARKALMKKLKHL